MNPADWLVRTAAAHPKRGALFLGGEQVATYLDFARRSAGFAHWLHDNGIAPGDRVAVFASNCPQYLIALYGIWHAGAIAVPVNAKLHAREAAWIVRDAGARLCVSSNEDIAQLPALEWPADCRVVDIANLPETAGDEAFPPHQTQPADVVWLFYTSGTTGRPKGVMITALNLTLMTLGYLVDVDDVSDLDAILYAAPMSHGAGLYNFIHVMKGARHVVPVSGGFDADEVLSLSAELRNVSMFAAPTMVRRLVDAARSWTDLSGIKTVVYGGGPMYVADIIEAVEVLGPRFVQIYGQGECPMAICALSRNDVADRTSTGWKERLASVGRPQSCVRVRVARADGSEAARGEVGEVIVQGAPVMAGYWNDPQGTAQAIRDGWLWTGDMGAMDENGFVSLHDRSKDVIISGGTNIYPREVEEVLLTHADVHEVSVIGRPSAEWGEDVVAFVTCRQGATVQAADLDRLCLASIARFKRPKEYFFVTELPKNNYGKVVKSALRDRLKGAAK